MIKPLSNQVNRSVLRGLAALSLVIAAGCSTVSLDPAVQQTQTQAPQQARAPGAPLPALPPAGSGRGGYYQDDGPGDAPPEGLLETPDAEPIVEPYAKRGNKPYVVFGKTYTPVIDDKPLKQRGIGSWYGKKFHGQKTSSGELYDMYKMTAAHPTLPIPSYVRVTNVKNGKQVIVRVNDRGPFHSKRIIDLSYTAALKLGYLSAGSGELEVERILPAEIEQMAQARKNKGSNPGAPLPQDAMQTATDASMSAISFPVMQTEAITSQPIAQSTDSSAPVLSTAAMTSAPMPNASTGDLSSNAANVFYLQFGAYAEKANAQVARGKLLDQLAGVVSTLDTVVVNGLHRLHAGPYASRAEAQDVARRVQEKSAQRAVIVTR